MLSARAAAPRAGAAGVDPVHFGAIAILNLNIGLLTPPLGVPRVPVRGQDEREVLTIKRLIEGAAGATRESCSGKWYGDSAIVDESSCRCLSDRPLQAESDALVSPALLRETWPFLAVSLVALVLVTYVPGLSLWLPRLLGF